MSMMIQETATPAELAGGVKSPRQRNGVGRFRLLRRLFVFVAPYRGRLLVSFATILLTSVLALAGPVMIRYLVDALAPGGDPSQLGRTALLLMAIFAVLSVLMVVRAYLLDYVGQRVVVDLALTLYRRIQSLSLSFFHHRRTGELVSRLTNDVTTVRTVVTSDLATGLSQVLMFAGALIFLLLTSWRLSLFMFVLVPVVAVVASVSGRRLRRLSAKMQDELATATTVAEEAISAFQVVRSFTREDYEVARYGKSIEETFATGMARTRVRVIFSPLVTFLFYAATVAILWFGGHEVLAGRLTTGQLVTFILLTLTMAGSISRTSTLWTQLQQAIGATERLFEILDTQPDVVEAPLARALPRVAGRLTLENVSFAYSAADGTQDSRIVLDGISLDIQPGEVLALVGPSGAGKTTLLNLLPRFYDPIKGRVLADGVDLRDVSLRSLREQIAMVPQETQLFGGTVRENLLYGKLDATEAEVLAAARAANAHDFIAAFPKGYDTVVGERGLKLSGGQRQRISIARALLKDPRILLLDEATSSLDSDSEHLVQEALQRLMAGRTTVVIAHRLSTVQHAHRTAVLESGRLVDLGSHDELLARDGIYARFCRMQFDLRSPLATED